MKKSSITGAFIDNGSESDLMKFVQESVRFANELGLKGDKVYDLKIKRGGLKGPLLKCGTYKYIVEEDYKKRQKELEEKENKIDEAMLLDDIEDALFKVEEPKYLILYLNLNWKKLTKALQRKILSSIVDFLYDGTSFEDIFAQWKEFLYDHFENFG